MSETCKTCKKKFDSGIWIAPQFVEEGVLLFCSENFAKLLKVLKENSKNKFFDTFNFFKVEVFERAKSRCFRRCEFRKTIYSNFFSEKCKKEYLRKKLSRIKTEYPRYYDKIMKTSKNIEKHPFWIEKKDYKRKVYFIWL